MISSFVKTPPELLSIIFTHLKQRDVKQCQLTCKNWSRPAQQQLYKKVSNLFITEHSKKEKVITKFFNTLAESPNGLGNYVKDLWLDDLFSGDFTQEKRIEYMDNLARLCPKVESLFGNVDNIMFWKYVVSLRSNGHWNRLKWLPSPKRSSSYPDYVNAVLAWSDQLESLDIICVSPSFREGRIPDVSSNHLTEVNRLINNLGNFTNLKHISIDELYGNNNDIYRFDYIIDKCPTSLISCNFKSISSFRSRSIHAENTTITVPQPRPNDNITEFSIKIFWKLNKDSVNYMIHKFPNLEKVCLDSTWEQYFQYPKQTAVDFLKFISDVPKFTMGGRMPSDGDANITILVDDFMAVTTDNLTTPVNMKLLYRQFKDPVFPYCDDDPSLIDYTFSNYVKISSYGSDSEIEHEWITTSKERSYNLDIQIYKTPREIRTPRESFNERLLKTSGSRISQLYYSTCMTPKPQMKFISNAQNQISVKKDDSLYLIFKYCTSLVNLDLSWMRLSRGPQRTPIINGSIKSLRFDNSAISEDALTALSVRLPALKNLFIKDCVFVRNHGYPVIFDMNNTSFESITFHFKRSFNYVLRKRGSNLIMKVASTLNRDNKIQYLKFDKSSVEELTSAAYSTLLSNPDCLSLKMLCKEISLLSVKLDDLPQVDYYFSN